MTSPAGAAPPSEIDPWAVDLYQKRFPDAINLGDIRGIDGTILADATSSDARGRTGEQEGEEPVGRQSSQFLSHTSGRSGAAATGSGWTITAGFPCQDISYAGAGAGLAGARSGLFYEAARIIGELGPELVVLENVRALLTRGIGDVLGTLSDLGYDSEWEIIRASDVGAPHKRERAWILAYPSSRRGQDDDIRTGRDTVGSSGEGDVPDPERSRSQNGQLVGGGISESDRGRGAGPADSATSEVNGSDVPDTASLRQQTKSNQEINGAAPADGKANQLRGGGEVPGDAPDTGRELLEGRQPEGSTHRSEVRDPDARDERSTQSGLGRRTDGLSAEMERQRL